MSECSEEWIVSHVTFMKLSIACQTGRIFYFNSVTYFPESEDISRGNIGIAVPFSRSPGGYMQQIYHNYLVPNTLELHFYTTFVIHVLTSCNYGRNILWSLSRVRRLSYQSHYKYHGSDGSYV
jgi:uncharacterized membrane protein YjfL (UPF0719 family)